MYSVYRKCTTRKCLTLLMKVKVTRYNINNGAVRWRISESVKVIRRIFVPALTVSEILRFQIFALDNLGHRAQHSQWCHSIANVYLHKVTARSFALALTVFDVLTFSNVYLQNLGRDHEVRRWQWRVPSKIRSRSRSTTLAVTCTFKN